MKHTNQLLNSAKEIKGNLMLNMIQSRDIDNEDLKKIYLDLIYFFKEKEIDIKKFMIISRNYYGEKYIDSITIDLDELITLMNFKDRWKMFNTIPSPLKHKFIHASSSEIPELLKNILQEEVFPKDIEHRSFDWTPAYHDDSRDYLIVYNGPQIAREDLGEGAIIKGIQGQFQDSMISSVSSYRVQVILNSMFCSAKELKNMVVLTHVWNMLEQDEINNLVADSISAFFNGNIVLKESGELLYGKNEDLLKEMLSKYGVSVNV